MIGTRRTQLIIQLCNKVQPLLPKGIDYARLTLPYKGEKLSWPKILYRICECEIKKYDGQTNVRDHIRMRYFLRDDKIFDKFIPYRFSPYEFRYISWYELSGMINEVFVEHRGNLQLWKERYKEYGEN